jgi:hypothetical protein
MVSEGRSGAGWQQEGGLRLGLLGSKLGLGVSETRETGEDSSMKTRKYQDCV